MEVYIAVVGLKTSQFGCEICLWITKPHNGSGTTADCGYTTIKKKVGFSKWTIAMPMDYLFFQTSMKIPLGFVKDWSNAHVFRVDLDY